MFRTGKQCTERIWVDYSVIVQQPNEIEQILRKGKADSFVVSACKSKVGFVPDEDEGLTSRKVAVATGRSRCFKY
jgi:hypothetical protein